MTQRCAHICNRLRQRRWWLWPLLALAISGCAAAPIRITPTSRAFAFPKDTLAFANQLDWIYKHDPLTGKTEFISVEPEPTYIHRCFVLVRTARQFFLHARFAPTLARADERTYRGLIREVLARSVRDTTPDPAPVVVPGYADLREFSADWTGLIKNEAGGSVDSYFQTGNWRMVFPFSRDSQQETAAQLLKEIHTDWPPIVHLVRFPHITINHAVLLYAATETPQDIVFAVYDPNHPEAPTTLTYVRASRTFDFPASDYFADGRVDVYEVYRTAFY
ncbi:MAG: hypothetical protein ACRESS_07460 [Stenotrophobium sp.]